MTQHDDKDFPPVSDPKNIEALAQWYLDYSDKIKPYLKPKTGE